MRYVVGPLNALEDTTVKLDLIDGKAKLNELPINVRINARMYFWCDIVHSDQMWLISNSKAPLNSVV